MLSHVLDEFLEQVVGIVGAGAGFWVVLHGEEGEGFVTQACYRPVVEIEVGDFHVPV